MTYAQIRYSIGSPCSTIYISSRHKPSHQVFQALRRYLKASSWRRQSVISNLGISLMEEVSVHLTIHPSKILFKNLCLPLKKLNWTTRKSVRTLQSTTCLITQRMKLRRIADRSYRNYTICYK